jgi:tRNA threonylcarbamoyladenosine biosynthesis protein TsaE
MPVYKTNSSKQTKKLAGFLAKKFLKIKRKNALVLALQGELGAGKTTFIQGFLKSLGVRKKITSPTFVLIKCYMLHASRFRNAYHIDCYRIKKASELLKLGLKEILENPQNIVLIEWAERIQRVLLKNAIWIKFFHGSKENIRSIRIYS